MSQQGKLFNMVREAAASRVIAMPIQDVRQIVGITGLLADKVGRQERLLKMLLATPFRPDCGCADCVAYRKSIETELARI